MFGEGISQTGRWLKLQLTDIIKIWRLVYSYNVKRSVKVLKKLTLPERTSEVFAEIDKRCVKNSVLIAGETTEGQTEEKAATKSSKAKKETAAESELVSLELDTIEIEE